MSFFSLIEINFVLFFGLSIQVVFLEVQKCDLRLLFSLNHINILFFPCGFFSFIEINFDLMGRGSIAFSMSELKTKLIYTCVERLRCLSSQLKILLYDILTERNQAIIF